MARTHNAQGNFPDIEDRGRLIAEAVSGIGDYAIFLLDANGHILTWNKGAQRIKGYMPDEVIGRHFSIFYTPEDVRRGHPDEELMIASTRGHYEEEGWRIRKDGTRFWANVLITRLTDESGKTIGFSKVTRDLTERKISEEELRSSEERFRLLVESVKDYAIFMLDTTGRVATWNEGAQRLKGYRADEIIGSHFSKFYTPEDNATHKTEYELQEAALTGRYEEEGWRIRKDGTRFWANVVISAIRGKEGKILGFAKVTRDLTERRRSDERMRRMNIELEQRVETRTRELETANQELQSAIRSRDEFLSIASHELKTPITSLKLLIQMLQRNAGQPDVQKMLQARLDNAARQVDRLSTLVEDLLDVSRAQSGHLSFKFEETDLSDLVRDAAIRMQSVVQDAGIELRLDLDASVRATVDPFRIEQVIINLLTNTVKYAPGKPVEVSVKKVGETGWILVRDYGIGIPREKHDKIFGRFERAVNAEHISGLGLGLYIVQFIVERHHGKITVESETGKGATFKVELPLNLQRISEPKQR